MNDAAVLKRKGPLLLACNHPNSFLDAIIIGSRFSEPVHFLARGDAFSKPWARKLLTALKLIPIYRLSEGRENLALNDATFEACRDVLLNKGILLIFSEGLCINDWKLRPLKKGTARIAIDAWQQMKITDEFSVLPVGINYNSFRGLGKAVKIHFNTPITAANFNWNRSNAELIQQFNQHLTAGLRASIIESDTNNAAVQLLISNHTRSEIQTLKRSIPFAEEMVSDTKMSSPYYVGKTSFGAMIVYLILTIPALAGVLLHAPLYYLLKRFVKRKTEGTVFYDSVLFGVLLITYPLYFVFVNTILWITTNDRLMLILALSLPAFAWIAVRYKEWLIGAVNRMKSKKHSKKMITELH